MATKSPDSADRPAIIPEAPRPAPRECVSEAPGVSLFTDVSAGHDGNTGWSDAGSHYLAINRGNEVPRGGQSDDAVPAGRRVGRAPRRRPR